MGAWKEEGAEGNAGGSHAQAAADRVCATVPLISRAGNVIGPAWGRSTRVNAGTTGGEAVIGERRV